MQYPTTFVIFLISVLISTVKSQTQPIVNVKTIQDTEPFTITCDVNRVNIPAEDANIENIFALKVAINTTAHPSTTVAEYHPLLPAQNMEYKNVPIGRTWDVVFSGGNVTSNRKTIKIEILVKDAKCTDAGLYSCSVQYYKSGLVFSPSTTQNVTAEAATSEPVLKLEPLNVGPSGLANYSSYNLNDSVTLTCRVDGPQNLDLKWRRERRPALGSGDSYEDYPYDSDIKDDATTQTGTGACSQFQYTSKLSFFISEDDKQRLYMCAVQANGVDLLTTSATVDLIIENTTPSFVETTPVVGSTPAASNGTTSVAGSTPAATNGTTPVAGSTPAASNGTTPVATPSSIRYDFDCFLTSMDVFIPVHLAPNSELTMKDKFCPLRNNGTHYVITFSYNECGTSQTTYSNNQLLVENAITVHVTLNKSGPVEFAPDYTIPLQCTINLNNSVHGAFQAVDRDFYTEKNAQSSDFEMKEFRSALYEDEITQYPVKVPLNRELFFELGLINVRRNGSGIRVDKCEATPTNNPNFLNRFLLITSGCSSSPAVKVLPRPGQDRFRFSIHAFHFSAPVNQNNLVYIHCYVNICQPNRCDSVCPQSKRRRRSSRNVRSVTLTSGIHIITA